MSAGKSSMKSSRPAKQAARSAAASDGKTLLDVGAKERARNFRATRDARRMEVAEDYVEMIADLIDTEGEARTVDVADRRIELGEDDGEGVGHGGGLVGPLAVRPAAKVMVRTARRRPLSRQRCGASGRRDPVQKPGTTARSRQISRMVRPSKRRRT